MPRLGMGAWMLGEEEHKRAQELEALRAGIDAGVKLIDTAEMYGYGRSEDLIGEAIEGYKRESIFLVSKVYPHNAGRNSIYKSLIQTLTNLRTDYLDLYLLHWHGCIPLKETVECMEYFVAEGKIKSWGVSNFDTEDMEELFAVPGGRNCVVNQVLYHLGSRGIEYDLLPWHEKHQVVTMVYCPLAQAGDLKTDLLTNQVINRMAEKYGVTVIQILLAFVLKKQELVAIPGSSNAKHVLANIKASELELTEADYRKIDREFPAPTHKTRLDFA